MGNCEMRTQDVAAAQALDTKTDGETARMGGEVPFKSAQQAASVPAADRALIDKIQEKGRKASTGSVDETASTRAGSKASTFTEAEYMGTYMDTYESSVVAGVLSWMGYSPPAEDPCGQTLHKYFPGSLPGVALHQRTLKVMMEDHGCTPENTLFGVSCCPDEINWTKTGVTNLMSEHWGNFFPLGGISGAPFSGKTGFGAFSAHVPDDGNVVVLFAPHVGISHTGEVGKHLREGQRKSSTSCGAVIGAYNCCLNGKYVDGEFDPTDMQMQWIKNKIAPHAQTISTEENPMAALALQSYAIVKQQVMKVVNTKFGKGKLFLIGGIMINMPEPYVDHFMPLHFEVRQEGRCHMDCMNTFVLPSLPVEMSPTSFARQITPQGPHGRGAAVDEAKSNVFDMTKERSRAQDTIAEQSVLSWLSWSPAVDSPLARTMRRHFPGALPGHAVHERIRYELQQSYALSPQNTILGLSICPDEINYGKHDMAALMRGYWSNMFPLGGISGAPFAGKTGYGAFAAHVPENGNIIVFFGPHVGITEKGEIGQYVREGQSKCSTSCGAVIGAYKACQKVAPNADYDENDMQMDWIKKQIMPHVCQICDAENPMAALSMQAYHMVKEKIQTIVNTNTHSGYVVLIGGIQLNLPKPLQDHFMPLMFEVHTRGALVSDLMSSLKCPLS